MDMLIFLHNAKLLTPFYSYISLRHICKPPDGEERRTLV